MIWLALLKRLWPLLPLAIFLGLLIFLGHRLDTVKSERDLWQKSAKEYQQNAAEWEASYKASEILRGKESKASVGAVNASEQACETRIKAARDSAVKIEGIVNRATPFCKPGEALERKLVDPAVLRNALSGL